MSTGFDRLSPQTRANLEDRQVVEEAYAHATIKEAARTLRVPHMAFALALRYHGIPVRKRGKLAPETAAGRLTRADVEKAALRAYARSGRCPPNCPGRQSCLDDRCILRELIQ